MIHLCNSGNSNVDTDTTIIIIVINAINLYLNLNFFNDVRTMSFSLSFHFVSFLTFLLHVQHFPFVYYFLSERRRTVSLPPFFPIENKMEETKLWSHVNFRPPSSSTLVLSRNRFLFGIERSWKLLKKKKRTSITRDFFFFSFFSLVFRTLKNSVSIFSTLSLLIVYLRLVCSLRFRGELVFRA